MKNLFTLIILCLAGSLMANNIQVSNVSLASQDTLNNSYMVEFDLSWDNSWRTNTFESNWDAAWVFLKYRVTPNYNWSFCALALNTGHVMPAGATYDQTNFYGVMIYRDSVGIGNVNFQNIQLQWDYSFFIADDDIVEVSVMAIEMVYIPEGSFYVGDGNPIGSDLENGNTGQAFQITSEGALTLGGTTFGNLSNNNDGYNVDDFDYLTTRSLPAAYPKGFDDFYIMKYEVSEDQYVAFLNKLSPAAAVNRFPNQYGNNGHGISSGGIPPNVYSTDYPERACNYLSFDDLAAYADWAGLRPMSELEYIKACRGPRPAVDNEYAWGSISLFNSQYNQINQGSNDEFIINLLDNVGNANLGPTSNYNRPYRCGIFAASSNNKTRVETGASYYGVMELTGNVFEQVVPMGNASGRGFTGNLGNAIISSGGASTVAGWPTAFNAGAQGGSFTVTPTVSEIGVRGFHASNLSGRYNDVGGRLVWQMP